MTWTTQELQAFEEESLGVVLHGDVFARYRPAMARAGCVDIREIMTGELQDGEFVVRVAGDPVNFSTKKGSQGGRYGLITIHDGTGTVSAFVDGGELESVELLASSGHMVIADLLVRTAGYKRRISVQSVDSLDNVRLLGPAEARLSMEPYTEGPDMDAWQRVVDRIEAGDDGPWATPPETEIVAPAAAREADDRFFPPWLKK